MNPIVNHLIQLQELSLIRDEQKVTPRSKSHTQQLEESIKAMRNELPPPVREQFNKLQKKDHIAIAPIADGRCSLCSMALPISLVQAVRVAKTIHSCPNCARMLYYPESVAKWIGVKPRRSAPRKIGISRFSSQTLMIPKLASDNKEDVIHELASKMEDEGFVDKASHLHETALRREAILSTGVDHGLAFPHARGVEGGGLTLALGIHRKGLEWGGSAKPLIRIVFFMAIPTAASAFYLKVLAGLTETFMKADARKAVSTAKDADDLWRILCRVTRVTIK